jgi:hypothetical protein
MVGRGPENRGSYWILEKSNNSASVLLLLSGALIKQTLQVLFKEKKQCTIEIIIVTKEGRFS